MSDKKKSVGEKCFDALSKVRNITWAVGIIGAAIGTTLSYVSSIPLAYAWLVVLLSATALIWLVNGALWTYHHPTAFAIGAPTRPEASNLPDKRRRVKAVRELIRKMIDESPPVTHEPEIKEWHTRCRAQLAEVIQDPSVPQKFDQAFSEKGNIKGGEFMFGFKSATTYLEAFLARLREQDIRR